jgi:hypothetical protein
MACIPAGQAHFDFRVMICSVLKGNMNVGLLTDSGQLAQLDRASH